MIFSFISIVPSSNNLANSKMLNVAIVTYDDGQPISEFESYIKAIPRLSIAERQRLTVDYSYIKSAPPLSDVAPNIIEIIENTETVFLDKFSESTFKKAFREIGYPVGAATFILEKIFKKTLKFTSLFNLQSALELLNLEDFIASNADRCKAMESVFSKLDSLGSGNFTIPDIEKLPFTNQNQTDFTHLPSTPGVYFFRDNEGNIIYVGKAKNIVKRVRSHFTNKSKFEVELCLKTETVDFEETGSETIALLLEAHYINELKPSCNTLQKDVLDPYIITSKIDSKGILRIQLLQKSYMDSENEFYYNRTSVLQKVKEIQQKFNLCRRYTGIERTSTRCSDPVFCKGICEGLEDIDTYNDRVKEALDYIFAQRPSYIIKLKGRNQFEQGLVLVKNGIYHGFGFIDAESNINSIEDIEGFVNHFPHNYFTSRTLDQYFKTNRNASESVIKLQLH